VGLGIQLKVEIASNSDFTSNLLEILTIAPSNQNYQDWQEYTYDVSSYSGGDLYMRVGMKADGTTCNWQWTGVYLDYVTVEDTGGGGVPAWENLVVTVTGSPTIESITGYQDFGSGTSIIVKYTEDISGRTVSVVYKPRGQLLKTQKI